MKKTWCIAELNSRFLARMEQILWLYALPYNPLFPVVCFDERPCFLIGDLIAPLNPQVGQIAKEHYAYLKNGSCCLLAGIEPLTGARLAQLPEQRTKREFALFMKALSQKYPEALKIRVVLDNLNTHDISAFYETFPAQEALDLAQRFEFYFTPKSASWLNMIEIEFSALSRQCLNRRIPTREIMEREVIALVEEREQRAIKINWQFSIAKARTTFEKHYELMPENAR